MRSWRHAAVLLLLLALSAMRVASAAATSVLDAAPSFDVDALFGDASALNDLDSGVFNHFVQHAASHTPVAARASLDFGARRRAEAASDYAAFHAHSSAKHVRKNKPHDPVVAPPSAAPYFDAALHSVVSIEPPSGLAFGVHAVGTPVVRSLRLTAPSRVAALLIAVASSCGAFRVQAPQRVAFGSHNVSVVFIPRALGLVECQLTVTTSVGQWRVPVSGAAVRSPYRVAPFVDATTLVGRTWQPALRVFNPSAAELGVREVRTSGGGIHVMLPSRNEPSGQAGFAAVPPTSRNASSGVNAWNVAPFSYVTVGYLNVNVHQRQRYEGFVALLLTNQQWLVLPVQVAGVSDGVHALPSRVAFGTLVAGKASRRAALRVMSGVAQPVLVLSVRVTPPDLPVQLELANRSLPLVLRTGEERTLGHVVLRGDTAFTGTFAGAVVLLTNDTDAANARIVVPLSGTVVRGGVSLAPLDRALYAGDDGAAGGSGDQPWGASRVVRLQNHFDAPITVVNVTLVPRGVARFAANAPTAASIVVPPGGTFTAGTVQLHQSAANSHASSSMPPQLELFTNVSLLLVPLRLFSGELDVSVSGVVAATAVEMLRLERSRAAAEAASDAEYGGDDEALADDAAAAAAADDVLDFNVVPLKGMTPTMWVRLHNGNDAPLLLTRVSSANAAIKFERPVLLTGDGRCHFWSAASDCTAENDTVVQRGNASACLSLVPLPTAPRGAARDGGLGLLPPHCTALLGVRAGGAGREGEFESDVLVETEFGVHTLRAKGEALSGTLKLSPPVVDGTPLLLAAADDASAAAPVLDLALQSTFGATVRVRDVRTDDARFAVELHARAVEERSSLARVRFQLDGAALSEQVARIDKAFPIATSDVVFVGSGGARGPPPGGSELLRALAAAAGAAGRALIDSTNLAAETVAALDAVWLTSTPALQHELTRLSEAYLSASAPASAHKKDNATHAHFDARLTVDTDVQTFRAAVRAVVPRGSLVEARALSLGRVHVGRVAATFVTVRNWRSDAAVSVQLLVPREADSAAHQVRVPSEAARRRVVLAPGAATQLGPILVRPERRGMLRALLRIATNASLEFGLPFETVSLTAESGSGALSLSGVAMSGELLFQYQAAALAAACGNGTISNEQRLLTRRLHLVNNGDLSLRVTRITIDGADCASGGFGVVGCGDVPFELAPREQHPLTLVFVSDFSKASLSRTLRFHTHGDDSMSHYSLRAHVPPDLLLLCAGALPLSVDEERARYAAFAVSVATVLYLTFKLFFVRSGDESDAADALEVDPDAADKEVAAYLNKALQPYAELNGESDNESETNDDDTPRSRPLRGGDDDERTIDDETTLSHSDDTTTTDSVRAALSPALLSTTGGPSGSGRSSPATSELSDEPPVVDEPADTPSPAPEAVAAPVPRPASVAAAAAAAVSVGGGKRNKKERRSRGLSSGESSKPSEPAAPLLEPLVFEGFTPVVVDKKPKEKKPPKDHPPKDSPPPPPHPQPQPARAPLLPVPVPAPSPTIVAAAEPLPPLIAVAPARQTPVRPPPGLSRVPEPRRIMTRDSALARQVMAPAHTPPPPPPPAPMPVPPSAGIEAAIEMAKRAAMLIEAKRVEAALQRNTPASSGSGGGKPFGFESGVARAISPSAANAMAFEPPGLMAPTTPAVGAPSVGASSVYGNSSLLSSTPWMPFAASGAGGGSGNGASGNTGARQSIDDGSAMFALPAFFQDEQPTAGDAPLFDGLVSSTTSLLDDIDDTPWDKWSIAPPRAAAASPLPRGSTNVGVGGGGDSIAASTGLGGEATSAYNLFSGGQGGLFGSFGGVFGAPNEQPQPPQQKKGNNNNNSSSNSILDE